MAIVLSGPASPTTCSRSRPPRSRRGRPTLSPASSRARPRRRFSPGSSSASPSYVAVHTVGHLNLTLVALVPLCALLALRRFRAGLGRRRYVILLALALTGQFLLSAELFLTLTLGGVVVAAIALWRFDSGERRRLRTVLAESLAAFAVAAVLLTPYLVHAFVLAGPGDAPRRTPLYESADAANLLLPARRTWLQLPGSAAAAERYTATGAERGAYLGLPLLALVALFALRRGRDARRAVIALSLLALVLLSLGPRIRIAGTDLGPGPWLPFAKLPVTESALPVRLTLYVSLLAALACALWLAEPARRTWLRWALALAALVAVAPNPAHSRWTAEVPRPVFFTDDRFERHLPRGQTALVLPYGPAGWSLLWQAESGMAFRLVGGHLGRQVTAAEERWRAVYRGLGRGEVSRPELVRFLREHRVRTVIVAPGARPRARRLVEGLGFPGRRVADVLVVRLPSLREASPPPRRSARPRSRHGPRWGVGVE